MASMQAVPQNAASIATGGDHDGCNMNQQDSASAPGNMLSRACHQISMKELGSANQSQAKGMPTGHPKTAPLQDNPGEGGNGGQNNLNTTLSSPEAKQTCAGLDGSPLKDCQNDHSDGKQLTAEVTSGTSQQYPTLTSISAARPKYKVCKEAGCQKRSERSTDGQRVYCKGHMRLHNLMPSHKLCQVNQCTKRAQPSTNGERLYCKAHMLENGLQHRERNCQHAGCDKRAQTSATGLRTYCKRHMKQFGMQPRLTLCKVEGCPRQVQYSAAGKTGYCTSHMKELGLTPRTSLCQFPACSRHAVANSDGKTLYCRTHIVQTGMKPKQKGCQWPSCNKRAQMCMEGLTEYCKVHMRQMGREPKEPKCHMQGCRKRAQPGPDAARKYCKSHQRAVLQGLQIKLEHDPMGVSCTSPASSTTSPLSTPLLSTKSTATMHTLPPGFPTFNTVLIGTHSMQPVFASPQGRGTSLHVIGHGAEGERHLPMAKLAVRADPHFTPYCKQLPEAGVPRVDGTGAAVHTPMMSHSTNTASKQQTTPPAVLLTASPPRVTESERHAVTADSDSVAQHASLARPCTDNASQQLSAGVIATKVQGTGSVARPHLRDISNTSGRHAANSPLGAVVTLASMPTTPGLGFPLWQQTNQPGVSVLASNKCSMPTNTNTPHSHWDRSCVPEALPTIFTPAMLHPEPKYAPSTPFPDARFAEVASDVPRPCPVTPPTPFPPTPINGHKQYSSSSAPVSAMSQPFSTSHAVEQLPHSHSTVSAHIPLPGGTPELRPHSNQSTQDLNDPRLHSISNHSSEKQPHTHDSSTARLERNNSPTVVTPACFSEVKTTPFSAYLTVPPKQDDRSPKPAASRPITCSPFQLPASTLPRLDTKIAPFSTPRAGSNGGSFFTAAGKGNSLLDIPRAEPPRSASRSGSFRSPQPSNPWLPSNHHPASIPQHHSPHTITQTNVQKPLRLLEPLQQAEHTQASQRPMPRNSVHAAANHVMEGGTNQSNNSKPSTPQTWIPLPSNRPCHTTTRPPQCELEDAGNENILFPGPPHKRTCLRHASVPPPVFPTLSPTPARPLSTSHPESPVPALIAAQPPSPASEVTPSYRASMERISNPSPQPAEHVSTQHVNHKHTPCLPPGNKPGMSAPATAVLVHCLAGAPQNVISPRGSATAGHQPLQLLGGHSLPCVWQQQQPTAAAQAVPCAQSKGGTQSLGAANPPLSTAVSICSTPTLNQPMTSTNSQLGTTAFPCSASPMNQPKASAGNNPQHTTESTMCHTPNMSSKMPMLGPNPGNCSTIHRTQQLASTSRSLHPGAPSPIASNQPTGTSIQHPVAPSPTCSNQLTGTAIQHPGLLSPICNTASMTRALLSQNLSTGTRSDCDNHHPSLQSPTCNGASIRWGPAPSSCPRVANQRFSSNTQHPDPHSPPNRTADIRGGPSTPNLQIGNHLPTSTIQHSLLSPINKATHMRRGIDSHGVPPDTSRTDASAFAASPWVPRPSNQLAVNPSPTAHQPLLGATHLAAPSETEQSAAPNRAAGAHIYPHGTGIQGRANEAERQWPLAEAQMVGSKSCPIIGGSQGDTGVHRQKGSSNQPADNGPCTRWMQLDGNEHLRQKSTGTQDVLQLASALLAVSQSTANTGGVLGKRRLLEPLSRASVVAHPAAQDSLTRLAGDSRKDAVQQEVDVSLVPSNITTAAPQQTGCCLQVLHSGGECSDINPRPITVRPMTHQTQADSMGVSGQAIQGVKGKVTSQGLPHASLQKVTAADDMCSLAKEHPTSVLKSQEMCSPSRIRKDAGDSPTVQQHTAQGCRNPMSVITAQIGAATWAFKQAGDVQVSAMDSSKTSKRARGRIDLLSLLSDVDLNASFRSRGSRRGRAGLNGSMQRLSSEDKENLAPGYGMTPAGHEQIPLFKPSNT